MAGARHGKSAELEGVVHGREDERLVLVPDEAAESAGRREIRKECPGRVVGSHSRRTDQPGTTGHCQQSSELLREQRVGVHVPHGYQGKAAALTHEFALRLSRM